MAARTPDNHEQRNISDQEKEASMPDWPEYVKIFTALPAILNPWGVIPMFLALSGSSTNEERKHIAINWQNREVFRIYA
jgi:hypothetical protein